MVASTTTRVSGGRPRVHQRSSWFVIALATLLSAAPAAGSDNARHEIRVREEAGVYLVDARFEVAAPAAAALAVLTDYEQIPRFMPDVRRSTVLERTDGRALVEQEASARFMMFVKRVHLVLEVHEEEGIIRFQDRCGRSFARYEGTWTITEDGDGAAAITYQLAAKPSFDVPEFLLKRLLKRDADQMIQRLQAEIANRTF
jgi:ribosome-associated toxin RatA of RatAB toxin-antitoxin module